MDVQNIPAKISKTTVQHKIEAETNKPNSEKENCKYYILINFLEIFNRPLKALVRQQ
jgi:hypothetical protein